MARRSADRKGRRGAAPRRGRAGRNRRARSRPPSLTVRVLEFRRYRLKPGARETLVELFDREFVESQEGLGMRILGTFRDLDDPDQFVWLRGFDDMASRL